MSGITEQSILSVVLLPNQEDSAALIGCSAAIGNVAPSAIALSNTSLPHITVAQFLAEPSEAEALWHEVEGYKGAVAELTSVGLAFAPSRSRDETWVALDFMKSRAVTALHEAVLAGAFAHNHQMPHNAVGDMYWPHATLALLSGRQAVAVRLDQSGIFQRAFTDLALAVGSNGPHMTFAKINFS